MAAKMMAFEGWDDIINNFSSVYKIEKISQPNVTRTRIWLANQYNITDYMRFLDMTQKSRTGESIKYKA